jgi:hypothetical protein
MTPALAELLPVVLEEAEVNLQRAREAARIAERHVDEAERLFSALAPGAPHPHVVAARRVFKQMSAEADAALTRKRLVERAIREASAAEPVLASWEKK